ncbi:hypothetical protein PHO31112_00992 [Pandoraea horticolens]|uniref:Uncharacterized protein n=1 Tax=Pandoraea horticolens TaxID=2508298 RepID=A0A5E4SVT2_9BURK|nr:hypothetical protein PHO31112_00992 [Pandoraea horticolens]
MGISPALDCATLPRGFAAFALPAQFTYPNPLSGNPAVWHLPNHSSEPSVECR